jgi:diguanylate cyclase (GGDEF)-like protein
MLGAESAVQIGIAIAQMRHNDELQRISSTDALTGLLNRRMFFETLKAGLNRADGRNRAAAMGYVDLDYFKAVNDVHGHQKGDLALQRVGDLLRANTKPEDLIARLGGDEFAVFLSDCDEESANVWGAQMLEAAKALIPLSGAPDKPLGLSVGLVVYEPRSAETPDQLTQRADEAMYSAKRAGKGRVRVGRRSDAAPTH